MVFRWRWVGELELRARRSGGQRPWTWWGWGRPAEVTGGGRAALLVGDVHDAGQGL